MMNHESDFSHSPKTHRAVSYRVKLHKMHDWLMANLWLPKRARKYKQIQMEHVFEYAWMFMLLSASAKVIVSVLLGLSCHVLEWLQTSTIHSLITHVLIYSSYVYCIMSVLHVWEERNFRECLMGSKCELKEFRVIWLAVRISNQTLKKNAMKNFFSLMLALSRADNQNLLKFSYAWVIF